MYRHGYYDLPVLCEQCNEVMPDNTYICNQCGGCIRFCCECSVKSTQQAVQAENLPGANGEGSTSAESTSTQSSQASR